MSRRVLALTLAACSGAAHRPAPPVAPPAASTTCYAGRSVGMGKTARTLARRRIDPAAGQIFEDVSHDEGGAHGAKSFHVVMVVDGDHFTMTETGGAFTGSGTLVGEPWRWTSWSSTSEIPHTGITVESDDELTETGMTATKQITREGKLVATTKDELKAFDCAEWDKAVIALAAPPLDAGGCEAACRNYAQLKFWDRADAEIAALPGAEQAVARTTRTAELATQLDRGVAPCVESCVAANNATQTACLARAASVADLTACE